MARKDPGALEVPGRAASTSTRWKYLGALEVPGRAGSTPTRRKHPRRHPRRGERRHRITHSAAMSSITAISVRTGTPVPPLPM